MYVPESKIINEGTMMINDDTYSSLNKGAISRSFHTMISLDDYKINHTGKFLSITTSDNDYTTVDIVSIEKITPHYMFNTLKKDGYSAFRRLKNRHYRVIETSIMMFKNIGLLGRTLHDNSTMWNTIGLIIAYNEYKVSHKPSTHVKNEYEKALSALSLKAHNNYEGSLEQLRDEENCPVIQANNNALINLDTIMNKIQ